MLTRAATALRAFLVMVLLAACASDGPPAPPESALERLTRDLIARGLPEECFLRVIESLDPSDLEALVIIFEDSGTGTLTLEPAATAAIVKIGGCRR